MRTGNALIDTLLITISYFNGELQLSASGNSYCEESACNTLRLTCELE